MHIKVVPGQARDDVEAGRGCACIHLFVRDESGPFVEPHVLDWGKLPLAGEYDADGNQVVVDGIIAVRARGRLACDPKRTVAPVQRGGEVTVTMRSDDPRAVTCPKCIASDLFRAAIAKLGVPRGGGTDSASERPVHGDVERVQPGNAER